MKRFGQQFIKQVRVAERSKAPDVNSGHQLMAWVRIPPLTILFFKIYFFLVKRDTLLSQ